MTTVTFAHPYGSYQPGDSATIPDDEAALLLGAGLAHGAAPPVTGLRADDVAVDAASVGRLGRATAQATMQALAAELAYLRSLLEPTGPPDPPVRAGAYGSGAYGAGVFGGLAA